MNLGKLLSVGSRLGLFCAACFFVAPFASATDEKPAAPAEATGTQVFAVTIPAGKFTAQHLSDVVKSAAVHRGWTIKENTPERVVIFLSHRDNVATVTFDITDTSITAYTIPNKKTDRWLRFLHKDIEVALGIASK